MEKVTLSLTESVLAMQREISAFEGNGLSLPANKLEEGTYVVRELLRSSKSGYLLILASTKKNHIWVSSRIVSFTGVKFYVKSESQFLSENTDKIVPFTQTLRIGDQLKVKKEGENIKFIVQIVSEIYYIEPLNLDNGLGHRRRTFISTAARVV